MSNEDVIVRYPPSPTGELHVGNLRTILFNYLFATKLGGKRILRIEDTDKKRSKKEYEDYIIESLKWLGIEYDEFHRQSDRTEIYSDILKRLVDEGKAYISEEEEGESSSVIRVKNTGEFIEFEDIVFGKSGRDVGELGDFVIAKDFETPLYHFAVVVDDYLMGVTHIIRGQDHIPNTPRQIFLQRLIGAPTPKYAHLPLIVNKDGKKLSKRDGSVSVLEYREKGYLPEAFINFIAFLGWNPKDDREIFGRADLIAEFSLENINKNPAVFSEDKLNWFNRQYIRMMDEGELLNVLYGHFEAGGYDDREKIAKLKDEIVSRIYSFGELDELIKNGEFDYFFNPPVIEDVDKITYKDTGKEETADYLESVIEILEGVDDWRADSLKDKLMEFANDVGRGKVLWPLRYVLCGKDRSPDPFTILYVIGKDEGVRRIREAIKLLR